jgi:tellurite resistance protein
MAGRADFSEQEWKTMQKGVTGAGMLVSVGDRDFSDSFGEASALAKYLASQRQANESSFIRELADVHGSGFGMTASPQEVETETLASLSSSVATLTAKAPDEVGAYRQLVLDTMSAVGEAKGGVTAAETAAMDKITQALGAA